MWYLVMRRNGLSVALRYFDLLRIEGVLLLFYCHRRCVVAAAVVVHRGNIQFPNQTIETHSRASSH